MSKPIVAITGRPNVGKSTIFNRIVQQKLAIVDPESGVTRDKKHYDTFWNGRAFTLIDTGGIVPNSSDTMEQEIKAQAEIAMAEADVIVFTVDTKTGITPLDEQISSKLFPVREKLIVAANKIDHENEEVNVHEFQNFGLGDPIGFSAINGRNFGDFLDAIISKLPEENPADDNIAKGSISIAVVGKPNVGKSTLVNKIVGSNSVIVTDIPGTTRDSIHLNFTYADQKMTIIDTAGLRKKSRVDYGIEYFSNLRSIRSVERADLVLFLYDANEPLSVQDKRILELSKSKYKNIIIVVNKWDLIKKENETFQQFTEYIYQELDFIDFAPLIFISALTGKRVHKLLGLILQVENESRMRISTSELNKFLEKTISKFPPRHPSKKHVKILYCTQVGVHPPTFVFSVNSPALITTNYKRYLHNQLRQEYGFSGSSIKLKFLGKKEKK